MNKKLQLLRYLISDLLASAAGWSLFYFYRKHAIDITRTTINSMERLDRQYFHGLLLVPLLWILINYFTGYYKDLLRKSRLFELWQTLSGSLLCSLLVFFIYDIGSERYVYGPDLFLPFISLFIFHFVLIYIPRLLVTNWTTHKVHRGEIGFNTLLIGSDIKAFETWQEVMNQKRSSGNKFMGFIRVNNKAGKMLEGSLPNLGSLDDLRSIIFEEKIEEVIIAIESDEHDMIHRIINILGDTDVIIKAIPSMYDILTGRVRMNSILGTPLISVSHSLIPPWQENVKVFIDYFAAVLALVLTLPLSLVLIIGIKITSRGPVFYSHERVGRYGKPFKIYKFRSMVPDAEKDGPELSSKTDGRVTHLGKFMRRTRIDEIPNFINVLMGDMSLVGPRPERKHFIDQILRIAPHYQHLLKIKPGITSWGQVKYGYAENVEQMAQRLKYDLIYLDNMSLFIDFKIIIYTVLTILKRKGI